MSDNRITKFNHRAGKMPLGLNDSKESVWQSLKNQAERLVEEVQEVLDGVNNRDIQEVLDGVVDVWYVREWMDDMLEALGIDVEKAKHEVAMNNLNKITEDISLAKQTAKDYGNCFVFIYNDKFTTYYTVLRSGDNKVMKLKNHVPPNLSQFIPLETKMYFSEK
jgi:NTP pyrophosphatase (non-canonical NTP hydrolase)